MKLRLPPLAFTALAGMLFVAMFASAATAATATSGWFRFFGPTLISGQYQCAKDEAIVDNTGQLARGNVAAYEGSACTNALNRPAGHLGVTETLIQGSSGSGGTICGFSDWQYNTGTAALISRTAWWTGPSGSCPSGAAYYTQAKGRYWRTDTGNYVTPNTYRNSPNLNF